MQRRHPRVYSIAISLEVLDLNMERLLLVLDKLGEATGLTVLVVDVHILEEDIPFLKNKVLEVLLPLVVKKVLPDILGLTYAPTRRSGIPL